MTRFPCCFRCSGGDPDSAKSATGRGEQHRPAKPLGITWSFNHEEENRKQLSTAVHLIQCNCNAVVCQMIVSRSSKMPIDCNQPDGKKMKVSERQCRSMKDNEDP